MALKIENFKIVGKPTHLQKKLNGELPIDRLELIYLVNSWGRSNDVYLNFKSNICIKIDKCAATQSEQTEFVRKECYDLSSLDVSQITDMEDLFSCSLFNADISFWDVSKVTNMSCMFSYAKEFNQDISKWNTSNVINMNGTFLQAINFNQDLNNWDVSNVTYMGGMFCNATNFNGDILSWNVSKVTNMNNMFSVAKNFNSDISNWDVSNVNDMNGMFSFLEKFNQDISQWNVSNVTNMDFMFAEVKLFNQNISKWNLNKIDSCKYMFLNTEAFIEKYNNGEPLPRNIEGIKDWLIKNREKMNEIDIKVKHGEEIDDFFSNITDIYSTNRIGLHNNIHSLPISIP